MTNAERFVQQARKELQWRASPEYARRVQMFFKEPVRAYGWRTADVRKLARRLRREILKTGNRKLLLAVAEKLFAGSTLEEKTLGVVLLEREVKRFGTGEFLRLERWLRHVTDWSACDGLATGLLGPLLAANPRRVTRVFQWAKKANRWPRRAAAAALVPAARRGLYPKQIFRLANLLVKDKDYMVQKGVGWLLREAAKTRRAEVVAFLLKVRKRAPRMVLRIACETLPPRDRRRILALP